MFATKCQHTLLPIKTHTLPKYYCYQIDRLHRVSTALFSKKRENVLSWSNCGITSYQTYPPLGPLKRVCCITLIKPTYFNPRSCIFDHFGPEKRQKQVQPVLGRPDFIKFSLLRDHGACLVTKLWSKSGLQGMPDGSVIQVPVGGCPSHIRNFRISKFNNLGPS